MKKKTLSAFLAALFIVTIFSACKPDKNGEVKSSSSKSKLTDMSESDSSFESNQSEVPSDSSNVPSNSSEISTANVSPNSSGTSTSQPANGKAVTLNVKDFGAKGDGKTDDAQSIFKAVSALRSSPSGSVLTFEAGKTYYYKNNGTALKAVFYFENDSGLTLRGNNCLIKLGGFDKYYAEISNCKDMVMEGFNFDYEEYKPAFAATLDSIDITTGVAVLTADRPINLENGETYVSGGRDLFATIPAPTSRVYLWIQKYEMIDAASRKVRVYFRPDQGNYSCFSTDKASIDKYGLVMPMPRTGNETGFNNTNAIAIKNNSGNMTFKNINIYSAGLFCVYLRMNDGVITLDGVNCVRAPYDQNLRFVSWGDSYHPVNNRAKIIIKNSKSEFAYDDVFNFNTSTMYVAQKHSNTDITLNAANNYTGVPKVMPGDTLTIINRDTGMLIGRPVVKSVVKQEDRSVRVVLAVAQPSLTEGQRISAWNDAAVCHPDSEISNCNFDGTFRIRGKLTVSNSRLNVRRFWMGLEVDVEGTLPRNILFKNCDLTGDGGVTWHIQSLNNIKGGYHIENIVFENCKGISMDKVEKGAYDEVTIK